MTDPASTDTTTAEATPASPAATESPTAAPPAETKPVETKPAETKPAETKPAETKPADAPSAGTAPRKIPWGGVAAVVVFLGVAIATQRGRHAGSFGLPGVRPGAGGPGAAGAGNPMASRPMTTVERAVFAPLTEGGALGPATITRFEAGNGTLTVHVQIGGTAQIFRVAHTASTTAAMHLRATGPYTVYLVGPGTGSDHASVEQAWRALEAVLRHNTSLPVPPNLLDCCPFNGSHA